MSLETLLKNFGGKKSIEPAAPVQTEVIQHTQFESLDSGIVCGECGCNFFWRYNKNWFCGRCRKPPTPDFVHEVSNGEFVPWVMWRESSQRFKKAELHTEESVAVEAYDSVIVAEGDNACPECPCRWVKETPREDGSSHRTCYSCKATIEHGRHGTIRSLREEPIYLLPFWRFYNERSKA